MWIFVFLRLRLLETTFAGSVLGSSGFSAEISSSLAAELPPPYTAIASPDASGVPVINCRVCQSLINLDGKLHQHVVKCTVCNEATVKWIFFSIFLFVGVERVSSPGQGGSLGAIPREKDESAQLTASVAGVQARGMLAQGWS